MRHVCRDLNIDTKKFEPKAILGTISNAKNELQTPSDYAGLANGPFEKKLWPNATPNIKNDSNKIKRSISMI